STTFRFVALAASPLSTNRNRPSRDQSVGSPSIPRLCGGDAREARRNTGDRPRSPPSAKISCVPSGDQTGPKSAPVDQSLDTEPLARSLTQISVSPVAG